MKKKRVTLDGIMTVIDDFLNGCFGTVTIVFVILKLTGLIEWSWIWVLSLLWMLPLYYVVLVIVCRLIAWLKWKRIRAN